jgi:hypothetical protein
MSTWRSNVVTLMQKEREVHPNHPDPSGRAPRTYAALFTRIVAAALLAACGPNPHTNPVPRVPTPTPEPNRQPQRPGNPKTLSVMSTQAFVNDLLRGYRPTGRSLHQAPSR